MATREQNCRFGVDEQGEKPCGECRRCCDELKAALEHSQANLQIVGKSMDESELLLIAAQDELVAIVDACGFEYDSDPDAPRTLVGYVREVHGMAVDQAEHVTSDHIDAAVRRLSISSRHTRARLARTAAAEGGGS